MRGLSYLVMLILCIARPGFPEVKPRVTPGGTWDPNAFRAEFAASPRIVRLSISGMERNACFMYVARKSGAGFLMSVLDAGPSGSCSGKISDYLSLTDEDGFLRGMSGHNAKFIGERLEKGLLAEEEWRFAAPPATIYFRVSDPQTGKEYWDAVCVGLMKYDNDRRVGFRPIVYPRENSNETITGFRTPEVKCGGIKFAVRNEIPTEKPKFLGSAAELEKLTRSNARASVGQNKPNH